MDDTIKPSLRTDTVAFTHFFKRDTLPVLDDVQFLPPHGLNTLTESPTGQKQNMWVHSPYGDADLLSVSAEGGHGAVTNADAVFTHRTGHLTPLTQVEVQVAEGLDNNWETCGAEGGQVQLGPNCPLKTNNSIRL